MRSVGLESRIPRPTLSIAPLFATTVRLLTLSRRAPRSSSLECRTPRTHQRQSPPHPGYRRRPRQRSRQPFRALARDAPELAITPLPRPQRDQGDAARSAAEAARARRAPPRSARHRATVDLFGPCAGSGPRSSIPAECRYEVPTTWRPRKVVRSSISSSSGTRGL